MIHPFQSGDWFHERYRLEKLVGMGGFADVWKAYDSLTDTTVALKIYSRLDDDGIKELATEYRRMQNINHPNLLRGDHFDRWNNMPYLEMQFCEGGSLERRIGKLTDLELISVIRDLCEGLQYLHRNGIIHQDIKPANILIDKHGHYLLSDFGISSRSKTRLSKSVNMANVSSSAMTEAYAPPEKFSPKFEDRQPDAKGDIFSLGISLYELITGDLPFGSFSTGRQLQYEKIELDFAEIEDERIRTLIAWCMQREKENRPTAAELVSYLNSPHTANHHPQQSANNGGTASGSGCSQQVTGQQGRTTERMDHDQQGQSGDGDAASVVREETKNKSKNTLRTLLGFGVCAALIIVGIIRVLNFAAEERATPDELIVIEEVDHKEILEIVPGEVTIGEEIPTTSVPLTTDEAESDRQAEERRIAQEQAEARRIAEQQAEQARQAEERRIAQERAEAARIAKQKAEQARQAEQRRIVQEQTTSEEIVPDTPIQEMTDRQYFEQGEEAYENKNYKEAIKWYRKAAERGYVKAQYIVGWGYFYGVGGSVDHAEAVRWYRKAAWQGQEDAQYELGNCYHFGYGVSQDYAEAVKWYRKAAEQGHKEAQYELGSCYYFGFGVKRNRAEAVKWYRKAAEQGYAEAQSKLGDCYEMGHGVKRNRTEAEMWYRKAAEQGDTNAINRLLLEFGIMYN